MEGKDQELILGTAQFGLNYGITNLGGKVTNKDISSILEFAATNGVRTIDTAAAYGDSEIQLGFCGAANRFRIITKIPPLGQIQIVSSRALKIQELVKESLRRLKSESLFLIMFHDPLDFSRSDIHEILRDIIELKECGLVSHVGVSIYSEDDWNRITDIFVPDIVQAPVSIFDQRLLQSGALQIMYDSGVVVHARSVFLQGLAISNLNLPPYFESYQRVLCEWHQEVKKNKLSPLAAALGFIRSTGYIKGVVVGVTSVAELSEIVLAWKYAETGNLDHGLGDFSRFASSEVGLLDPRLWIK
jgi:hypothetical protein